MDKLYVIEVDCKTQTETIREMTADEAKAHLEEKAKNEAFLAELEKANKAREEAKASALAKLAALGLTEEEAKAIVG